MKPIIRVENLGKQYRIGALQEPYGTFRESLVSAVKAPFKRLRDHSGQSYDTIWALKDVSFEVMPGEVVGIIGRNGAGKSTLLKVLSRITEPTIGGVDLYGRVGSLLEVGTGFHAELTGRENIYLSGAILGMKKSEITRRFDEIVAFAEVEKFIDTPVKRYSSGMYLRLAFAVAAHLETDILLVDEVLAVGDSQFQKKCVGKIGEVAKVGRTILFVSHNLSSISQLCNRGIVLREGGLICNELINRAIDLYINEEPLNQRTFNNHWLKYASVKQTDENIEITANYNPAPELAVPSLGFVISDYLGAPITGTNPIIDEVIPNADQMKKGKIRVLLESPKLLDGTYRLSLWFGDRTSILFHQKDCLIFEVVNMLPKKQLPSSYVGPVFPKCDWYFE